MAPERGCCSLEDVEDARAVAYRLGIPHYVFNYTEDFRREVMDKFIDSYLAGRTPNPCIDCNRCLKFGSLLRRARELGCDAVVTGHYARIEAGPGGLCLKKGLDPDKDQSYVLYNLSREQLAMVRFPLGASPSRRSGPLPRPRALSTPGSRTARTSASSRTGTTPGSSRPAPASSPPRETSWTAGAGCWAATGGSSTTPWASAGAWACPSTGPTTSQPWTPRPTP